MEMSQKQLAMLMQGFTSKDKPRKKIDILCPKCNKEAWDAEPNVVHMSNPPKKRIFCDCGYEGLVEIEANKNRNTWETDPPTEAEIF